jgi:Transglycosylase SLT domain
MTHLSGGTASAHVRVLAGGSRSLIGASGLLLALGLMLIATVGGMSASLGGSAPMEAGGSTFGVSALAQRDVPPAYLSLYEQAARRYGLDWAVLAAIGKVECDHGRDPDPSCAREGAVNGAGAGGPMQFLASTWHAYGVDVDGDGVADRWAPADAIFSAASYLRATGAPSNYRGAIFAYNHAAWYVIEVERWAARYRAPVASGAPAGAETGKLASGRANADVELRRASPTPVRFIAGERAVLEPGDSHVALVPADVPATVQAMVVAGNELQGLPYGPGGHPDPRGAYEQDCSSSLNYLLYRSGVRPVAEIVKQNPLAQDYVRWGLPGPGRWVTIYASPAPTPHVFIVVAGLRLDTSHNGTDIGPNRGQDGPRWRVLNHIPTWAHWSVRHPTGL